MTDFCSMTPSQVRAAEQAQDDDVARAHATREMLDYWLGQENELRAKLGMSVPVTLRLPEETN